MEKLPAVYIVTNKRNGTLYTGVTSNLVQRIYQHRMSLLKGFSKRHHCLRLVYFERHDNMLHAIQREKQLKAGSRAQKLELIEAHNPLWLDLYEVICR